MLAITTASCAAGDVEGGRCAERSLMDEDREDDRAPINHLVLFTIVFASLV